MTTENIIPEEGERKTYRVAAVSPQGNRIEFCFDTEARARDCEMGLRVLKCTEIELQQ